MRHVGDPLEVHLNDRKMRAAGRGSEPLLVPSKLAVGRLLI